MSKFIELTKYDNDICPTVMINTNEIKAVMRNGEKGAQVVFTGANPSPVWECKETYDEIKAMLIANN